MIDMIEFEAYAGTDVSDACRKSTIIAENRKKPVHFEFNGTDVIVQPGESAEVVQMRWKSDYDAAAKAYREHPDRLIEAAERERKDKAEREAVMVDSSANEIEMREAKIPWPKTIKQLNEYIESLAERNHDYGTCVYAVSMASVATFNYMAGVLNITGFQSGCADFDILRRTRNIKGPFMLIDSEKALYPQYDLYENLDKALEAWKPWLKAEATKKLAEAGSVHPKFKAHWEKLAAMETEAK